MLTDMEKQGVIKPSTSSWAGPVVLAPKKDGKLRFCVDCRHLYALTKKNVYPLPRIEDILDTWEGQNTSLPCILLLAIGRLNLMKSHSRNQLLLHIVGLGFMNFFECPSVVQCPCDVTSNASGVVGFGVEFLLYLPL